MLPAIARNPPVIVQLALIVAVGSALGVAINFAHPRGVTLWAPVFSAAESGDGACEAEALIPTIDAPTALALCDTCAVAFVDARGSSPFEAGHIATAVHLPPKDEEHAAEVISDILDRQTVIVYGDNTECDQASSVATRLVQSGHVDVRVLAGGWPAWSTTGQPATSGACEACLDDHDRTAHD